MPSFEQECPWPYARRCLPILAGCLAARSSNPTHARISRSGADHTSVAKTFEPHSMTSLLSFLTPASLRFVFLLTRSTESVIESEDRSAALDDLQFARRCRIEEAMPKLEPTLVSPSLNIMSQQSLDRSRESSTGDVMSKRSTW